MNSNTLRDFTGLSGLKLTSLGLSNNQLSDISRLNGLLSPDPPPNELITLDLRNNRIKLIGNALDAIERGYIYSKGIHCLVQKLTSSWLPTLRAWKSNTRNAWRIKFPEFRGHVLASVCLTPVLVRIHAFAGLMNRVICPTISLRLQA